MDDILSAIDSWYFQDQSVALATVVSTWGSSPRGVGAKMVINSDGEMAECKFPFNPNGSIHDIAGICDSTGRVFGLMPHPEAFNHPSNHPNWFFKREKAARSGETFSGQKTTGIQMFQNAVDFFS